MGRTKKFFEHWSSGFVHQSQYQADSDVIGEYERMCEQYGPQSEEAERLRPHVERIQAARAAES